MKNLIENKLHQNRFFASFFIFFCFDGKFVQLKWVKIFHQKMDFDENFDAFAPAFKRESLFLCEINRVLFSPHSPHKV